MRTLENLIFIAIGIGLLNFAIIFAVWARLAGV